MGLIFPLGSEASKEKGFDIDLEIGANSIVCVKQGRATNHQQLMGLPKELSRADDRPSENGKIRCFLGKEKITIAESKTGKESLQEKSLRKPSKPPKPPRTLALDAAEQKMVREMSELAVRKRLRIERMRSIRNMKNANVGFNWDKFCVLFVTILLCGIIIWHGITSRGGSVVKAHGSNDGDHFH